MPNTAPWNFVEFNSEGPNAVAPVNNGIGAKVGIVGRVVLGTTQDPGCPFGQCCPVINQTIGCFAMENSLFVDWNELNLNNGNINGNYNGCAGYGSTQPCTVSPTCPNGNCAQGEYYNALPNINYNTGFPGAQWLIVAGATPQTIGQINGCVEIIDIVDETTWNTGQVTCPTAFVDGDGNSHPGGTTINYTDLNLHAIGGDPITVVETDCNSCVENILGCTDPFAINYQKNCAGAPVIPTLDDGCCYYPGCPDSSALNYSPPNTNGCGTISNGSWVTGGPTDTSCCNYPGCSDNVTTPCDIGTPIITASGPIPGPLGCVANFGDDCFGNPVIPATGGNLVPPNPSTCWTNDCYYVGCTDPDATNYNPAAHGCEFPTPDGLECCEYLGCDDPTAQNYGESCNGMFNVIIDKNTTPSGPCVPDNCIDPPIVGCMDDGCCVDGTSILANPTPLPLGCTPFVDCVCDNGLHLCPPASGPSVNSNFPPGCTPGIDCVGCNDDPNADQHNPNMCACEGGYVCTIDTNPGCTPGVDCCIDVYTSPLIAPYNWSDPNLFGPCTDSPSCISALVDCNEICQPQGLEECAIFMNDKEGNVYFYGPPDTNPNQLNWLFQDMLFNENAAGKQGSGSWDIANTSNKLWLYSCRVQDGSYNDIFDGLMPDGITPRNQGLIREYDITLNPFTYVFNRDIDITEICANGYHHPNMTPLNDNFDPLYHIGNGLVAKDNNTLIAAGKKVIEIDITTNTGVETELFVLPTTTYPSIDSTTAFSGYSIGDIIYDSGAGDLIVTYYDGPNPGSPGRVGKFTKTAMGGAQMGMTDGTGSSWYEAQVQSYATLPYLFGLFTWDVSGTLNWYASQATVNGAEVFDLDISTLGINAGSPIGNITTVTSGYPSNPIYGASQKDGCTPLDIYCCTDPAALNFVSVDCIDDGTCIYPAEGRGGCLPRLTKEEFLMNVVQKPETQSDIFIERGKVSVFERPQRLAQTSTIGELELHGYGYYNILIQE